MPDNQSQNLARKILSAAALLLFIVLPVWLGLESRGGPDVPAGLQGMEEGDTVRGGLYILDGPRIRRMGEKFIIEWTTSRPADSVVRFGKGDSFGRVLTKGEAFVKQHRVELPSIPYVWLYNFWIVSQDRYRHPVSTTFGPDRWREGAALIDVSNEYPLLCRGASPAFWADFDGDLDPDVLLAGTVEERRQARLLCREEAGYRDCTNRLRVGSSSGTVTSADWADFDEDGYSDLLACCQGLVVCQNYGPPAYRLGRATTLIEVGQESPAVAAYFIQADVDERLDVVALQADGALRVYRNLGPPFPSFGRAQDLEPGALTVASVDDTSRDMETGDFNSDGRDDLILLPEGTILQGSDRGYEVLDRGIDVPPEESLASVACHDFDADGDADILGIFSGEGERFAACRLFRNTDEGFVDVTGDAGDVDELEFEVSCAAWIDVTGEGHADLILGSREGELRILLSDGKGTFTDATGAFGIELDRNERVRHISGAEITGDNEVDLFITFSAGQGVVLQNRFAGWAPRRFVAENPRQ